MLKNTETEETMVFFVTFLSLVASQLGRARAPWALPLATSMIQLTVPTKNKAYFDSLNCCYSKQRCCFEDL